MIRRLLFAAVLPILPAFAGPPLTTIQDVLYKADGARFNGTLTISWNSFQAVDNSSIVTQTVMVKVLNGNLRVQLVATTTSTPPTTYTVVYNSDGRVQFQETWAVPVSAVALHVRDVRVIAPTGGSGSVGGDTNADPIPESQVIGLVSDLSARPLKGPGLAAGRVAVVNGFGALDSAIGTPTDCIHVDGSSGPCGGTQPSFIDGDSPAGIVDGANTLFTLSAIPAPATSLNVYRNGMLQKITQDYTFAGNAIQFVAANTPQPGDTLLAGYRIAGTTPNTGPASVYSNPQVLCSGTGAATTATTLTSVGTCTVPAGVLLPGDRVEVRFGYSEQGGAAFSIEIRWGATMVVHRDAAAGETLFTGRADAGLMVSGAQLSSQTWGAASALAVNAVSAADDYGSGLVIDFRGLVAQSGNTLTLANFSVVRIP